MVLATALCLVNCGPVLPTAEKEEPAAEPVRTDPRGFDPLELPRDREVIPETRPQTGALTGRQALVRGEDTLSAMDTSLVTITSLPETIDTVNNQTYRVQIGTSQVFGEARQAAAIAEEIFDRPVFVDYEVPYYKVRVGSFDSRDNAEAYQQKARAAGYANAWVVVVTLRVKEAAGLYENLPVPQIPPDSTLVDSTQYEYEED